VSILRARWRNEDASAVLLLVVLSGGNIAHKTAFLFGISNPYSSFKQGKILVNGFRLNRCAVLCCGLLIESRSIAWRRVTRHDFPRESPCLRDMQ
jgi:hypothetical protein